MPGMDMGKNEVAMQPDGPGTYVGAGRFTMDGAWQVQVTAIKNKDKTVQFFPLKIQ
jgi:nitrogen fixation protein FixH